MAHDESERMRRGSDVTGGAPHLTVWFADESRTIGDGRLTFGRAADISIDDNTQLHRSAGAFTFGHGRWWLHNTGSRLRLCLVSESGTVVDLAPGDEVSLAGTSGWVRLAAGRARYELEYAVGGEAPDRPVWDPTQATTPEMAGATEFKVEPRPRDVDFLVTLARPQLEGTQQPTPTIGHVAALWGVSESTVNNTLGEFRSRLRDAGLIRSGASTEMLIRVVIANGLIGQRDLEWAAFDQGPPRPARDGPRFN